MTTDIKRPPAASELTGYDAEDRYLATRYRQGGRAVYSVDLSVPQLVATLPKPDATRRLEGNRKISPPHARSFASYIRERDGWVVPPVLLRAPASMFEFKLIDRVGGTEWGVLTIPRLARNELAIIDGQHRILGFHIAVEDQTAAILDARAKLASAKKLGDPTLTRQPQADLTRLEDERKRLGGERVSVQIVVVDDPAEYKQLFVDIADNARGITRTTLALFDTQKVVNRCLDKVMEHPLLKNRVDIDRDRVFGANPNLMGAKHVADIIRELEVGLMGRISRRLEDELKEEALIEQANAFFDTLVDAFKDFVAIVDGSLDVIELRERSLLGSPTMLRSFAGAYHDLLKDDGDRPRMNRLQVIRFFDSLAGFMVSPVTDDSPWVTKTQQFPPGSTAPIARREDLKALTTALVTWAIAPPDWLKTPRAE